MDEARAKALNDGANMSTGGVNFNYVDVSKLERAGIDRYDTKKPKGNNFIRIVAPSKTGAFGREIWKHGNVGANNATFLCLDKMYGEKCPICEHIQKLKRANADSDVVKELYPGRRFLLFVVDTTSKDTEDEGPKWFDCPITIYREVCGLSQDRRTGEKIDPTDPEDGRDIEFVRNDGKRTSYGGFKLVKTDPIPKSWYEDLPTFDDILLKPTSDEMEEAVSGTRSASKETDPKGDDRRDTEGSRDRSTRDESRERPDDSEQAASVRGKIDEIRNRRRSRSSDDD